MNIAFDPNEWSAAMPQGMEQDDCAHPEWHALRARLRATVEAWDALEHARGERRARPFGSFSRRAARSLGRRSETCGPVNQTDSGNRKRDWAIFPDAAGLSSTGGREQQ